MGPCTLRCFYTAALTIVFAVSGFASPVNFKLLPLVPAGAQIVAGFKIRMTPASRLAGYF